MLEDYDLASDKTPSSKKNCVTMNKQEILPPEEKFKK